MSTVTIAGDRRPYLDAIAEVKQAREAFAGQARAGFNAMAEYLAWERAVARARRAAAVPAEQFEQKYQQRLSEFRWLTAEARRLEQLAPYAGKIVGRGTAAGETEYASEKHDADCKAWLDRASAYTGAPVAAVAETAVRIDPIPKGSERPGTPAVPGPPPYVDALRQAVSGG